MKKKLNLTDLNIKSFVTIENQVVGGNRTRNATLAENPNCHTIAGLNDCYCTNDCTNDCSNIIQNCMCSGYDDCIKNND